MTSSVDGEIKLDFQEENMKPPQQRHNRGRSLRLYDSMRALLRRGMLRCYMEKKP